MKIASRGFWADRLENIRLTARRFPLPVLCSLAFAVLALLENHDFFLLKDIDTDLHLWALVCGFFLLGGLQLAREAQGWSGSRYLTAGGTVFALLWLYLYSVGSYYSVLAFLFPSLVLFVVVAPYIAAPGDEKSFWYFNYQTWWNAGFGFAVSLVLCLGVVAILATLDYLFGIDMPRKLYFDVWALGFSVFWPLLALSGVPGQFVYKDACEYPRPIRFMVTWILVPLVTVYLVILYAYALKILIMWELPKGKLGYMVSGFGVTGIVIYLIAFPIKNTATGLTQLFFRRFYAALLVPVGLLLLAIFTRIGEMGMTENRYAVLLAALWFLIMAAWFIARGNRVHIKYNPMILAALGLLAAFGPWGAVSVSTASQMGRLEDVLVRNGMFAEGKILPVGKNANVSFEDRKIISSVVQYLADSGKIAALRPLLSGLKIQDKDTAQRLDLRRKPYSYINAGEIVSAMGITYVSNWNARADDENFTLQGGSWKENGTVVDISGFGQMLRYSSPYSAQKGLNDTKEFGAVRVGVEGNTLRLVSAAGREISFDLAETAANLRRSGVHISVPENLRHLLVLEGARDGFRARVYIESLSGRETGEGVHIIHVTADILLSEQP